MGKTCTLLPATPLDYRRLAERRLPRFLFDYIDGGANDEITLAANVGDFAALRIKQHVLRNVDHLDTATTLAGQAASFPLAIAPVGMAGLYHRRGEVQGVKAANAVGVPFTLSTVGICSLEEVQAASSEPFWFQLYMIRDRGAVRELLRRAWDAGCRVLVFTVDLPMPGMRHRDTRNGMVASTIAAKLGKARQLLARPGWLWNVGVKGRPHSFGTMADRIPNPNDLHAFRQWLDDQFDPTVTWDDITWLREIWKGKLLLKGIQEPEDAQSAHRVGADGLVVSNHGGRQLDSVASSISKLAPIAQAVGQHMEVLLDSGVRSGVDIFKALALGASGVLVGRPWVWALAAQGQAGVEQMLMTLRRELEVTMALAGVTRIADITRDCLEPSAFSTLPNQDSNPS
jgi:L-lactate dehydrogenase (cytochrome)